MPGEAGQHFSPAAAPPCQQFSLAADREEIICSKKRFVKEGFAVEHRRRTDTKRLKC
jgi:hypothetical protein